MTNFYEDEEEVEELCDITWKNVPKSNITYSKLKTDPIKVRWEIVR